jgi:hypothetical protein
MDVLLKNIFDAALTIAGIGVFILLAYYIILYKIERNRNDILEMDNVGLEHYNTMLKNKLQKKKEVLAIQEALLKENNIKC